MASTGDRIDAEVAVVGAGPAGLTAALALAAAGASVALVAPASPPSDHRTTALLSGSVEFLDRIGAYASFADKVAQLRTMRLVDGTRRLVRAPEVAFHASELGLDSFGVNVANTDLVKGLTEAVDRLDGRIQRIVATLEDAVVDHLGAISLRLSDGRDVACRLAIAADGRKSRLRDAAGITTRSWSYPQTAMVLNLDHTEPHFDTSTEIHTETGPFTLVPLAARRSSLVCVETAAEAERLTGLDDGDLATELERRSFSILGRLTPASPRQTWPMSSLSVSRMIGTRVALVGETAHAFPPIGAQGLNLGIRDIAALADLVGRARKRGEDIGSDDVLGRYASARRADVASRTLGVDMLNRSLLTGFLPVQVARAVTMQLARDVGPFRKLMMREGLRPRLFAGV